MRTSILKPALIVTGLFFLASVRLSAQNYVYATTTGNTIIPGTTLVPGSQGDDVTANIVLPFTYQAYGVNYNSVTVCSNGNMQFTTNNTAFTNVCPLPAAAMGVAFHPHWDDLWTSQTGGGIFTSVTGSAPNRILNIEWRAQYFPGTGTVKFEAKLFEGIQRVDFVYGQVDQLGASASIGVQNFALGLQTTFSCNTSSTSTGLGIAFIMANTSSQPCAQNFDGVVPPALPTGWTASSPTSCAGSVPWATTNAVSYNAPNSATTNDPGCVSDEVLDSRTFPIISGGAILLFRNSYDLENTFDGMVLEISIGGGPFTDIIAAGGTFITGGYNGVISTLFGSPIAGRPAWTGNSGGFVPTQLFLPVSANGQNVVIRWRRATDVSVSAGGVWIDDITIGGSNCTSGCTITCPGTVTVSNTPGQCGAVVNYPAPTTNGGCGTVTTTPASGYLFPVGTTMVVAQAFSGPICAFVVRVNDVQPPVITCPSNITTGNTTGFCGALVNFNVTATDNCPGVTVVSAPASGSLFPVGTTTVTNTATDASGNTATCTFTITVNDVEPPSFTSTGLFPERLYYKFDGSGTVVPNLASNPPPGTANANIVGNLTQSGTGKCGTALVGTGASGLANYCNTNWITNMTPPWTISFWLGPNQIDNNPSYLWGTLTAGSFRCFYGGAALTNNVLVRGGTGDILITGVNPAATFITVVYNGSNTVVYKNGGSPQTYAVTFPANIGSTPLYVGAYNTTAGTSSMNGSMDEFSLYTRALTAPEVLNIYNNCPTVVNTCPSNITVNNDPGVCGAVVNYTTPVGRDNCPGVTTIRTQGLASGSLFPLGTTTCTYVATDAVGLMATCTFTVTVVDAQPPALSCPPNVVRNTDLGVCTATFAPTNPTIGDNCGVTSLTWVLTGATTGSSPASGINYVGNRAFNIGVTTVTYTAKDAAGNTSTCSFTITINDAWIPVITIQPATKFVCVGSNGIFSVTATVPSGAPLAYQWQSWNGSAWVDIPTAINSSYNVGAVTFAMNTNSYRVKCIGLCTTVISNPATLYINPLPVVSLNTSIPPWLLPYQSLTLTAVVSPGGGTYAWYFNGTLVPGQTGPTWSGITVDGIGTYRLVYTDPNGCMNSSADVVVSGQPSGTLFVYPNPNTGQFLVRFYNQNNESVTVSVYDAKGARVFQKVTVTGTTYTPIDVDLGQSTIGSGVYIVVVNNSSGKEVGSRRIVVRHK